MTLTKKTFWLLAISSLLIVPALLPILAQEDESESEDNTEEIAISTNPVEVSPLPPVAQERIGNLIERQNTRLEFAIARFTSISNRLHNQIETAEREGRDMAVATQSLVSADNAISNARNQLQQSRRNAETMLQSSDPAFHWQRLKHNYSETSKALTATLSALRVTIYNLQEN